MVEVGVGEGGDSGGNMTDFYLLILIWSTLLIYEDNSITLKEYVKEEGGVVWG